MTWRGQALGLVRGCRGSVIGVCVCVWMCACSPERASPHHRTRARCSVCPDTHMQIWHGSANNLHEFVYYGFMSLNFNLSSKKDSCVDEKVLKCVRGFTRRGSVLVMCLYRGLCVFRYTVHLCKCTSLHGHAARVHVFQWGDPLGGTVLRVGLRSGSPQMRSCFLWTDLPHHRFRLKSCMTKWCIPNLFWTAIQ